MSIWFAVLVQVASFLAVMGLYLYFTRDRDEYDRRSRNAWAAGISVGWLAFLAYGWFGNGFAFLYGMWS